ncbi:MAG: leucine-rich repeat domain-containing protein [Erysipelotrichales bacterium]|nr:leucine-rich repeat domain-containing protein [Erysipelotrichales bacterium]
MNKKKFCKIFFPILGTAIFVAGVYWSVIEFALKDYQNIGHIQFRYIVDEDGNSIGTPAYITGVKKESKYPSTFEVPSKLLGHPVVGIDADAFKNLERLKKVILPKTVEVIGDEAFAACPLLTDVVFKGTLKSVGNDIFAKSGWLDAHSDQEWITFGNFLYKYNGNNDTDFILKSENDKILGEDESKYVYIPSSITNFASGAFANQTHLIGVEMPKGYTVIERNMFKGCQNLKSVEINDVTTIQQEAFSGCKELSSIDLKNVTTIGSGSFKGAALESVTLNEEITTINQSAFEDCKNLYSINIPNNVTSIGNDAFAGDISLTNIELSDNVIEIGNRAFKGTGIVNFTFPKYVDTINNELFLDAKSLTSVVLPSVGKDNTGIRAIGNAAFKNAEKLTSIKFPKDANGVETIKTISDAAFEGSGIKSITIPKGISLLSTGTFRNCKSLEEVNFYEDGALKTINSECFSGTTSLKEIKFPNTVELFYTAVFKDSGVSKVELPTNRNFTTINKFFFQNCINLKEITIPENVETIEEETFKGCVNLTNITLGSKVKMISLSLFEDASSLASIKIPNDATSIGQNAFKNCSSLESITIPNKVNSIGADAFKDDEALENVYYEGTVEDWNKIRFVNEYSNPMVYAKHFFILNDSYEENSESEKWIEVTDVLMPNSDVSVSN